MANTRKTYYEWDKNPRMPMPAPPRGSCDCQFHLYDDPKKFPPHANPMGTLGTFERAFSAI